MLTYLSFWQTVSTHWSSRPPHLLKSFNLTQKENKSIQFMEFKSRWLDKYRSSETQSQIFCIKASHNYLSIKKISQLPLGIWEKQLPVEDYQDATDNVPPALEGKVALIKNSFDEPECPSCCCWLISKLDRPIDVKREEQ